MENCLVAIIIVALCFAYTLSGWLILKGEKTNFWSWMLWGVLDAIALVSTIQMGDSALVLWIYTAGSFGVALLAAWKKQFAFGWIEACAIGLAAICYWRAQIDAPEAAIILSTASIMLVGIPLLWHVYNKRTRVIDTQVVLFFVCAVVSGNMLARLNGDNTVFLDSACVFSLAWLSVTEYSRRKA